MFLYVVDILVSELKTVLNVACHLRMTDVKMAASLQFVTCFHGHKFLVGVDEHSESWDDGSWLALPRLLNWGASVWTWWASCGRQRKLYGCRGRASIRPSGDRRRLADGPYSIFWCFRALQYHGLAGNASPVTAMDILYEVVPDFVLGKSCFMLIESHTRVVLSDDGESLELVSVDDVVSEGGCWFRIGCGHV